jgi:hypothetical protein
MRGAELKLPKSANLRFRRKVVRVGWWQRGSLVVVVLLAAAPAAGGGRQQPPQHGLTRSETRPADLLSLARAMVQPIAGAFMLVSGLLLVGIIGFSGRAWYRTMRTQDSKQRRGAPGNRRRSESQPETASDVATHVLAGEDDGCVQGGRRLYQDSQSPWLSKAEMGQAAHGGGLRAQARRPEFSHALCSCIIRALLLTLCARTLSLTSCRQTAPAQTVTSLSLVGAAELAAYDAAHCDDTEAAEEEEAAAAAELDCSAIRMEAALMGVDGEAADDDEAADEVLGDGAEEWELPPGGANAACAPALNNADGCADAEHADDEPPLASIRAEAQAQAWRQKRKPRSAPTRARADAAGGGGACGESHGGAVMGAVSDATCSERPLGEFET